MSGEWSWIGCERAPVDGPFAGECSANARQSRRPVPWRPVVVSSPPAPLRNFFSILRETESPAPRSTRGASMTLEGRERLPQDNLDL